jgi:hypothetical protein
MVTAPFNIYYVLLMFSNSLHEKVLQMKILLINLHPRMILFRKLHKLIRYILYVRLIWLIWFIVFNATFSDNSTISWRTVLVIFWIYWIIDFNRFFKLSGYSKRVQQVFILIEDWAVTISSRHKLISRATFWNNLHQLRLKSKDWKAK